MESVMNQRAISARSVWISDYGLVIIFLLAIGPVITLVGLARWSTSNELTRDGVWTTGEVISRFVHNTAHSNRVFNINYAFTEAEGTEQYGETRVNRSAYNLLEPGTLVEVRYLPRDSRINELRGADRAGAGWQTLLTGVTLTMMGLCLLIWRWPVLASKLRAIKHPAEPARVTDRELRTRWYDTHPSVVVIWRDTAGQEGRTMAVREGNAPEIGTEIHLRRDPRSGRTWWEGELA
jgi:hypothetical protein